MGTGISCTFKGESHMPIREFFLKVLSPVHIGTGEEIPTTEILFHNNGAYRINIISLFQDHSFDGDGYFNRLNEIDVAKFSLAEFDSKTPLQHTLYSMQVGSGINIREYTSIYEMIKTGRSRLYIPGSSIKGAIRTAMIWYYLNEARKTDFNSEELIKAILLKDFNQIKHTYNRLSKHKQYFTWVINRRGKVNIRALDTFLSCLVRDQIAKKYPRMKSRDTQFLQWLEVSDTDSRRITPENASIHQIETFNATRTIPIRFEVLNPNVKLFFTIKDDKTTIPLTKILAICDEFYNKVVDVELRFSMKKQLENIPFYYELQRTKWKLRLGQGSGAWTTSLMILADEMGLLPDYIRSWRITKYRKKPKTRKLIKETAGNDKPLGWIKLVDNAERKA